MDETHVHIACEKCLDELSDLVGCVMGYYELLEGSDQEIKQKLGLSIDRLYKFTITAGDYHRSELIKKLNEN